VRGAGNSLQERMRFLTGERDSLKAETQREEKYLKAARLRQDTFHRNSETVVRQMVEVEENRDDYLLLLSNMRGNVMHSKGEMERMKDEVGVNCALLISQAHGAGAR
jgi:hypothetical protein